MINSMDLVDVWKDKNPGVRRYTWRGPNKKQSRFDYFLVSSDIEYFVQSSDIGLSYRSDHSPVSIVLKFLNQTRGRGTWKFNNSLLRDEEFVKKVKDDIKQVIEEYECDPSVDLDNCDKDFNIGFQLLWEIVKMKIRGSAISLTSYKKKQQNKSEREIQGKLINLNKQYILNPSDSLNKDMEKTEMELKILREKKVNGIITRAKAKKKVEGEKSIRYFCNLEKRNYLEKTIPNLILDNDIETSDQNVIQSELQLFYKKIYSSTEPIINKSHVDLFFNSNNPFITKPTKEEVVKCEGYLTFQECLFSLKNMKNFKSPGIVGFTVEFYKFFWNDIKIPLVKCLNESLDNGKFSVSQRQGLITCIPKEGKPKHFLKNWRPITLLNVDFKIASA